MNNYILTSDSYITIAYQTNSYTYNYIKTDNTYLHPYEFKTTASHLPKGLSEYIYIDNIDNDLFIPYWKNPNNDGDADGNGASSLNIKAWGVATIKEAVEIGGTISDSSQLIIKNSLNEYNCQLKDTTTVEYTDNKCVNYIDIERKVYPYVKLKFRIVGYASQAKGYTTLVSKECYELSTFYYDLDLNQYSIKWLLNGLKLIDIRFINTDNISHNCKVVKFSKNSGLTDAYTFPNGQNYVVDTISSAAGINILNWPDKSKTGKQLDNTAYMYTPDTIQISTADEDLIMEKIDDGYFDGTGTQTDPYIIWILIETN